MNDCRGAERTGRGGPFTRKAVTPAAILSIMVTVGLVMKIAVFDPMVVFRPVCVDDRLSEHGLQGRPTEGFRNAAAEALSSVGYRVDDEGQLRVSLWNLWTAIDQRAVTAKIVRDLIADPGNLRTRAARVRAAAGFEDSCEFVRLMAIEPRARRAITAPSGPNEAGG